MEFANLTPYGAALYRTQLPSPEGELLHSTLVVCCRYPLRPDGRLGRPEEIPQRPTPEPDPPADPAYGVLLEPSDFQRSGTDVIVLGDIIPPAPTPRAAVRLRAGPYDLHLEIFGDRRWTRRRGTLVPTPPEPFERMPLTWARSFGGAAEGPYGAIPFGANPEGRGFYLSEDKARDKPLPNIEDPDALITAWSDRPDPIGCGPYSPTWSLRLDRNLEIDKERKTVTYRLAPGAFDLAHPRLSGQRIEGGQVILEGLRPDRPIAFAIPPCPVEAEIQIADRGGTRPLVLDELLVDLTRQRVDLTWRKGFNYFFVPHQTRRTTVRARAGA